MSRARTAAHRRCPASKPRAVRRGPDASRTRAARARSVQAPSRRRRQPPARLRNMAPSRNCIRRLRSSSGCSTRSTRSGATTPAGVAAARSSRSATAPRPLMRAARLHEYGNFAGITVEEVEEPLPGEGEISLRVQAAGVNPVDWKVVQGIFSGGKPLAEPRGLGVDVAGIVERVGPGVAGVAPGDELLGSPIGPSFAELALSRPELLVKRPPGVSWEVAGSLAVVAGTAYATLARLDLTAGETLLILGASGGVGSVAIQLAQAQG